MVNADTIVRRKPELLASMMDGEMVMLDVESGRYFGLAGVGPHIWDMLEEDRSLRALVESVKAEFEVGADESVDQDVIAFVQKMVDKGLVTVIG